MNNNLFKTFCKMWGVLFLNLKKTFEMAKTIEPNEVVIRCGVEIGRDGKQSYVVNVEMDITGLKVDKQDALKIHEILKNTGN